MSQKVVIIGSGFAGLSAASFMARAGWQVTVVEKNGTPGGRAQQLITQGFTFDMGPSWYWMPDVFERYFAQFGKQVTDFYKLSRLDPSYRVYWPEGHTDVPASYPELKNLLESIESGAGSKLDKFLAEAAFKYKLGIQRLVLKPGQSLTEFLDWDLMKGVFRLDVFTSIRKHVHRYFTDERIRQLLEFPVLFLGALPENTPALYSLMNYADIIGGTWYPAGGMYEIIKGMYQIALDLGVQFQFNEAATSILVEEGNAKKVITQNNEYLADVVIGAADYQHIETKLLPDDHRSYSDKYWETRTMAPSCLLYYVGLNKRLKNVLHHTLFFDVSFEQHGKEIYTSKEWPEDPLFYVSTPSVSDSTVAPEGCENLMFLIPVAAGLSNDTEAIREKYFKQIVHRFEKRIGENIMDAMIYRKSFAYSDFVSEYNSFKGNAYGLANTLKQTAVLKPACRSKKIPNLFYTGQLTVPGPGVPPSLISGEVVASQVLKNYSQLVNKN